MRGSNLINSTRQIFIKFGVVLFAFIMLTEPLTTPPTRFTHFLWSASWIFVWHHRCTLVLFIQHRSWRCWLEAFIRIWLAQKQKLMLTLKEKIQISPSVYDFVFATAKKLKFNPGQYLEWTLAHETPGAPEVIADILPSLLLPLNII